VSVCVCEKLQNISNREKDVVSFLQNTLATSGAIPMMSFHHGSLPILHHLHHSNLDLHISKLTSRKKHRSKQINPNPLWPLSFSDLFSPVVWFLRYELLCRSLNGSAYLFLVVSLVTWDGAAGTKVIRPSGVRCWGGQFAFASS